MPSVTSQACARVSVGRCGAVRCGAVLCCRAMAPAAAQAPEIQFAQRLAANEKRIRDRAVKKLRGYISLRTQRPGGTGRRGTCEEGLR